MERPDSNQPGGANQGFHRGLVLIIRCQRIAGREQMASVHAETKPLGPLDPAEDGSQVLDPPAEARPLAGGVLYEEPDPQPGGFLVDRVDRPDDPAEAGRLAAIDESTPDGL